MGLFSSWMEVDRLCPCQPIWGSHCPGAVGTTQRLQQLVTPCPAPSNILIATLPMGIALDTTGDPVHGVYSELSKNWEHYKHMSIWKHIFKHMYVWKILTMPFSPSSKCTCSGVLLYWHLVGSAWEMGKCGGQAALTHMLTPPNTCDTFIFILVLRKLFWISTFLAGFLRAAALAAFPFYPAAMPDSFLKAFTMQTICSQPVLWDHTLLHTSWNPYLWSPPPVFFCWISS